LAEYAARRFARSSAVLQTKVNVKSDKYRKNFACNLARAAELQARHDVCKLGSGVTFCRKIDFVVENFHYAIAL
jgi:hypothetical protein